MHRKKTGTRMKLHLNQGNYNLFTRYGEGLVHVNGQPYQSPVLVSADTLNPWQVEGFDALAPGHFELLLAYDPEVVLLGTGSRLRFPPPRITAPLLSRQIGVEVMDTPAACRTFNILVSEGRRVVAAILL